MDTELVYSLLLDKALIAFLDTITITRYGHFTYIYAYTYIYKYISIASISNAEFTSRWIL